MPIKKKSDILPLLDSFHIFANWDAEGEKHYLVFEDRKRGGQWTLMKSGKDVRFSIHGRGADYCDEAEIFFEDETELTAFLWENRAAFNFSVRKTA